ncbi:MAG: nucleotidyl transferase AbiEii/AbiGii toxin family protein [Deltaproteobacteria bacterium]|nr:nucleotidyl transferase AbiEii/AbiGii toxin family protein [Deltaproteobacteria bacterium]
MTKAPTNIGASVRAKLLRLSKERKEDHQLLLVRYANERLLHRLASSPHAGSFVLKGAALFTIWTGRAHRATRDIDFLGFGEPAVERLRAVFEDVLRLDVDDDGVRFDLASLEVGPIREDQEYGGVRIALRAEISGAQVRLQVDVGFGDAITPAPEVVEFPALLDFAAPKLRAYPRPTVVAEKLEAMVKLGIANSRMKDFYDVVILSRTFPFDGDALVRAIRATFERRGTPLPDGLPVALTDAFPADATKRAQWAGFVRKAGARTELRDFGEVVREARAFLAEPLAAARTPGAWTARWAPLGPWAAA